MSSRKAAFFDRDGTLIHDVNYLSRLDDVRVLPAAPELLLNLQQQGYLLFVVTNQSGIARGFFDEAFVHATHQYVADLFAPHGITFTKFYFCPHLQDCACRKPKPGMLLQAAQEFNLDLSQSLMFGDKESDLEAGRAAGCQSFDITTFFAKPDTQYATLGKNRSL